MGSSSYDKLYSALTFQSQSGKFFKYEIYQRSDATRISACLSCLDELQPGVSIWVVINPSLMLASEHHHPEHASDEVKKHFESNHIQE